mgnify:CR=1 FL=1
MGSEMCIRDSPPRKPFNRPKNRKIHHKIVEFLSVKDYNGIHSSQKEGTSVLNIVLVEPEIPQNCGNIARTCAATGSRLHLIRPLGFDISERAVRRAGLDYWHLVEVFDYENLDDFFEKRPEAAQDCWLTTTKAPRSYQEARFSPNSWIFFGKETAGLPMDLRERFRDRCIRLPMIDEARSLNLSNTVAVCVYEALRQNDFPGLLGVGEMAKTP